MKILVFAASNSSTSINRQLVNHAAERLGKQYLPGASFDYLDIHDFEMPLYRADREAADGIPEKAIAFLKRIADSDALMVSFAEHNGHYPAAYKNLFDWASRENSKVYQGKPMLALSSSPGGGGAKSVLARAVESAPFFDTEVIASLSVPSFHAAFDTEAGALKDPALVTELDSALASFAEHLNKA